MTLTDSTITLIAISCPGHETFLSSYLKLHPQEPSHHPASKTCLQRTYYLNHSHKTQPTEHIPKMLQTTSKWCTTTGKALVVLRSMILQLTQPPSQCHRKLAIHQHSPDSAATLNQERKPRDLRLFQKSDLSCNPSWGHTNTGWADTHNPHQGKRTATFFTAALEQFRH